MTKPLARLWKALDEIPDATTDRREWSLRLGDDWPVAAVYLTATGRLAKEINCPSPGGDGCPRKVVKHADGRFRAVCGNKPAECDPVDLTREEATCLGLDRVKLASAVGAILDADPDSIARGDGAATVVGSHGVAAGVRIPIVLMIPGPMAIPSADTLTALGVGTGPMAIAVPTPRSIPQSLNAAFAAHGHAILALSEITTVKDHRLEGNRPANELLAALRDKLLATHAPAASGRAWLLPADARWEELVFEFTGPESLNIRFRGDTRMFDPQLLGMKRKRTGKPTSQWAMLQGFAENNGELSWSSPGAHPKVKKQKQLLSDKLILAFGMADDPIVWGRRANAYRTRFKISGTPLGFRHAEKARR